MLNVSESLSCYNIDILPYCAIIASFCNKMKLPYFLIMLVPLWNKLFPFVVFPQFVGKSALLFNKSTQKFKTQEVQDSLCIGLLKRFFHVVPKVKSMLA